LILRVLVLYLIEVGTQASDAVKVALITGLCTILAVFFGRLWSRREHHATYVLVNSRMEELLRTTRAEGFAEGLKAGRDASVAEGHARVAEAERVADRKDEQS
jgi:hypothetical protein